MKWTGIAVVLVTVLASMHIIDWCLNLGVAYAAQMYSRCGIGGDSVYAALSSCLPLALAIPYLGWFAAREIGVGIPVARCAALAAHAAWLTVLLIIEYAAR